ncbi:hypothetical protein ACJX0J_033217, partial [Zea mays]
WYNFLHLVKLGFELASNAGSDFPSGIIADNWQPSIVPSKPEITCDFYIVAIVAVLAYSMLYTGSLLDVGLGFMVLAHIAWICQIILTLIDIKMVYILI